MSTANPVEFSSHLDRLNPEQRLAVDTIYGPLMVIAGPGSGKTQILSLRVANILELTDASPSNILCLTFTDSGSKNMQERLSRYIGAEAYKVNIYTFHGFCSSIINQYSDKFINKFGLGSKAIEDYTRYELMKEILQELPLSNPLAGYSSEHGFYYLRDIIDSIRKLKEAGLDNNSYSQIVDSLIVEESTLREFLPSILEITSINLRSSGNKEGFVDKVKELVLELSSQQYSKKGLIEDIILTLSAKLNATLAGEIEPTKLKESLKKLLTKDKNNEGCLVVTKKLKSNIGLVQIYNRYTKLMYERSYYDFHDMIIEVNNILKSDEELRFSLIEKFQFVLVDEFQDTNGAQLNILFQLMNPDLHSGKPNIMAVGDDDQSIFKFQGATSRNILEFQELFDPVFVTLQKNYRSSDRIVKASRQLADQVEDRITHFLPFVNKAIIAHSTIPESTISRIIYESEQEESYYVAQTIKDLVSNGASSSEIAVITRKHAKLETMCEFLRFFGVPINYEKGNNVLHNPKVLQLIKMLEFVDSLNRPASISKEYLLAEIFGFECFGFDALAIRKLALVIEKEDKSSVAKYPNRGWISFLTNENNQSRHEELGIDEDFFELTKFFYDLSKKGSNEPAQKIIDYLVGVSKIQEDEENYGEYEETANQEQPTLITNYLSKYKSVYFDKIQKYFSADNLRFLSNLQFLINKVRSLESGNYLNLSRLVEILANYQSNSGLSLIDKSSFIGGTNCVNLMTAHKSKGLEFENVFVLSCNHATWCKKPAGKDILPSHLHLEGMIEDENDFLRLFYVAVTRAKTNLWLTSYQQDQEGSKNNELGFLKDLESDVFSSFESIIEPEGKLKALEVQIKLPTHSLAITTSEKLNLHSILDDYKLSVTHLNNFLDLENGGPRKFLEMNLLRFPQSKDKSAGYGTAIHETICWAYNNYKSSGYTKAPIEDLYSKYQLSLFNQRLLEKDYQQLLVEGKRNLEVFWKYRSIEDGFEVERSFKQGVRIGDAMLAGNIDKVIHLPGSEVLVVDYKTGKPMLEWEVYKQGERAGTLKNYKNHKHQNQLLFYKLLVEGSGSYLGKTVRTGRLEFTNCADYNTIPTLDLTIDTLQLAKLSRIIQKVWARIYDLNFEVPDEFTADYEGTLKWIDWLGE
jgi:DNA helicase II / ATP-dependent DNA helicase PcrA